MQGWEFAASWMDLFAFFLVTPEVLGRDRFVTWFERTGRVTQWVRSVWFGGNAGPFSLAQLSQLLILSVLLICAIVFGLQLTTPAIMGIAMSGVFLPAGFVCLYAVIARMSKPLGVIRAMAVCGAAIFVAGRTITIIVAWSKL